MAKPYRQSVQEEDDLFGANLSEEFDEVKEAYAGGDGGSRSRPWLARSSLTTQSSAGFNGDYSFDFNGGLNSSGLRSGRDNFEREREPYELLDDVPPAPSSCQRSAPQPFRRSVDKADPFELLDEVRSAKMKHTDSLFPDGLLDEDDKSSPASDYGSESPMEEEKDNYYNSGYEEDNFSNEQYSNQSGQYNGDYSNDGGEYHEEYIDQYTPNSQDDSACMDDNSAELNPNRRRDPSRDNFASRYPIDGCYSPDDSYREGKRVMGRTHVGWCDEQSDGARNDVVISQSRSDISAYQAMHQDDDESGGYEEGGDYYDGDGCSEESGRNGRLSYNSHGNPVTPGGYSVHSEKSVDTFDRLFGDGQSSVGGTPLDTINATPTQSPGGDDESKTWNKSDNKSPDSILDTPGSYRSGSSEVEEYHSWNEFAARKAAAKAADSTPLRSNMSGFQDEDALQENDRLGNRGCAFGSIGRGNISPNSIESSNTPSDDSSDEDSAIQHLNSFQKLRSPPQVHRQYSRQMNFPQSSMQSRQKEFQHVRALNKRSDPPQVDPVEVEPQEPDGSRYYGVSGLAVRGAAVGEGGQTLFPDIKWDKNGNVMKKGEESNICIGQESAVKEVEGGPYEEEMQIGTPNSQRQSVEEDEDEPGKINSRSNISVNSSLTERAKTSAPRDPDAMSFGGNDDASSHQNRQHQQPQLSRYNSNITDDSSMDSNKSHHVMNDNISVISDDTELRKLTSQHQHQQKRKLKKSHYHYAVKQKDSMEEDIKFDFEEEPHFHPYDDIKRNDSMENDMMNIDFDDEAVMQKQSSAMFDEPMKSKQSNIESSHTVMSPPMIKRQPFSFANKVDDDSMMSSDSYSDESEASNDPNTFPSIISQMNLGLKRNKEECASEDLVEQACEFLARGRTNDAFDTLNVALERAQDSMDRVKRMTDAHYFQKERGYNAKTMQNDDYEDKLESDMQQSASEIADVINNIGVVHEMNGDYQLAMNSFRDALDVYRRLCHRYENAGDADVDRTVSNIMQMGIALRSDQKRQELHQEAEELEEMTSEEDDYNTKTQLRMERLNILMCVLDLENESLGRSEFMLHTFVTSLCIVVEYPHHTNSH